MFASLTRLQALFVFVGLVVLAALSLTIRAEPGGAAITGTGTYSDVKLYVDIAQAVSGGEDYYHAATRLHRLHGFPTSPFVTVRLPTLAWIEAALGLKTAHLLLGALLTITSLAWFAMLRPLVNAAERVGATLLVLIGGAMVASANLVVTHELWAGVLVALATALLARGLWVPALLAIASALAIRELALPFVPIAAFWALRDGRRREAAAWLALLAAYALALYLHKLAVTPLSLPGDALSQGWGGMRGPAAPLRDIVDVTLINLLPPPLSYLVAFLALAGFLGAPAPLARIALPWLGAIVVLLAGFARPVNFYWAILCVPMVTAGLAFLPRLVRQLVEALRRRG
ncbi:MULTISPECIES: hypothetical protein [unclassified Novosphingobium]|uniref:hypothetical protein n=1 Tax=unclassified Novosphingobium TaxID=2644732 RepID=UPI00135B06A3|nr:MULTISPECIES: hypothetical protein [unclassified Novosphingobium]